MILSKILILLREFPQTVINDYIAEGGFKISALLSLYEPSIVEKKIDDICNQLGIKGNYEEKIVEVAKMFYEYIYETGKIFELIEQVPDQVKQEPVPDYKQLLQTISTLAKLGNYDLNIITLFDAFNLIRISQGYKNLKELQAELKEIIENTKGVKDKIMRQKNFDLLSDEDKQDRNLLLHLIKEYNG